VVCMPEQSNPVKVESMRALGAEVVFHGRDFDEAREHCEQEAVRHGYRYIHSGNEPALIAGVATYTLEILEAWPDTDVIVVPVGGGSGAAGACVAAKAVRSSVEVIGVQSEAAPAAYRSWRAGALVADTTSTFAEGLATRTAFELPQQILRAGAGRRAAGRDAADDREDAQPRRAGRRGRPRRGTEHARAVRGPQRGHRLQRRQHQPWPAGGAVAARAGLTHAGYPISAPSAATRPEPPTRTRCFETDTAILPGRPSAEPCSMMTVDSGAAGTCSPID
jgi:Pyridoxal-phosphate dependent enzyme